MFDLHALPLDFIQNISKQRQFVTSLWISVATFATVLEFLSQNVLKKSNVIFGNIQVPPCFHYRIYRDHWAHCLDLDLNEQNIRHYSCQWFHIKRNIKEKKILWTVLEGCTKRAWPIQPINGFFVKLLKWDLSIQG